MTSIEQQLILWWSHNQLMLLRMLISSKDFGRLRRPTRHQNISDLVEIHQLRLFPMPETNASDNADETSRKCDLYDDVAHMQTLRKRGRKTTSKVLFQVPFSFQPPEFCLKENINLEIYYIHSASQKTLRSHNEVLEFLLDVEIPRKGGSKKAKVVGAVDNQVSGSASHESSRRKEMSFASQIVNKMNSSNEEEHKGGMESMYKMKSSDEKGSNELDNKVMSDELKNKMKDLEKEIMPWDDDEMGLYKMEHILRYQHANNGEVGRWREGFIRSIVVMLFHGVGGGE
ncbi:hypothetical protein JHK85_024134 [Glycine max]|nr:hypothetical protein JHK85_024134 [Glycine max]